VIITSTPRSGPGRERGRHEKGTFWPEKPKSDPVLSGAVKASTVLTNLQRGNIPTIMQTVVEPVIMVRKRLGSNSQRAVSQMGL
jgi:hypothetical protein